MEKEIISIEQINKSQEEEEVLKFYDAVMSFNNIAIDHSLLFNTMMNIFLPKQFSLKKSLHLNPKLIEKL